MKVWLCQIGESLPLDDKLRKLRTAIIAEKLSSRGHKVVWWASAFDHLQKDWKFHKDTIIDLYNGTKIVALKGIGYKKNVSLARFMDHRLLAKKFSRLASNHPTPDIIIAAMPSYDLAFEAARFARRNTIPIIIDVRDQWPDLFIEFFPGFLQPLAKLALYQDIKILKETLKAADGIVSMMKVLLDWALGCAERKATWKDRVFFLGYKRRANSNKQPEKIMQLVSQLKNKFVVTFIGTFASYHNPSILVEAARILRNDDISFVIAGSGELFPEIKSRAAGLQNVFLPGWLDDEEINALLNYSHLGVCCTTKKAFFFPNKAFLYFSAGLPVISSFEGDLKEIIKERQIGFYYRPNDVRCFVKSIEKVSMNYELWKKMSFCAKRTFENLFEADKIYDEYVDHIELIHQAYEVGEQINFYD